MSDFTIGKIEQLNDNSKRNLNPEFLSKPERMYTESELEAVRRETVEDLLEKMEAKIKYWAGIPDATIKEAISECEYIDRQMKHTTNYPGYIAAYEEISKYQLREKE